MRSNVKIKFKNNENLDFLVYALNLREGLSEPYRAEVFLISKRQISPAELSQLTLEKEVSLLIEWRQENKCIRRFLNGIITAVRHEGLQPIPPQWIELDGEKVCSRFRLVIEPRLVLLRCARRTCDYRNTTPLEAMKKVLERHSITPVLDSSYIALEEYKGKLRFMQADETDFDFISRLMARYGISYTFAHSAAAEQDGTPGQASLHLSDGEQFPAYSALEFSGFPAASGQVLDAEKKAMSFPFDMKAQNAEQGVWKMDEFSTVDSIGVDHVRVGTFLPGALQPVFCETGSVSAKRSWELYDLPRGYSKDIRMDVLKEELQRSSDACYAALRMRKEQWTGKTAIPLVMPGAVLRLSSFYSANTGDKLPVRVIRNELVFRKDENSDVESALAVSFECINFANDKPEKRFCQPSSPDGPERREGMKIREAVVCDPEGNTDAPDTRGRIIPSANTSPEMPYLFMVRNELADSTESAVIDVAMTMPLGGKCSGLYRFPRVGDRVLVQIDSDRAFLLGYIPDATGSFSEFTEGGDQYTRDSALLRYTPPGEDGARDSQNGHGNEIGFSHFRSAQEFMEQKIIDGSACEWLYGEATVRNDLALRTEIADVYKAQLDNARNAFFGNPDRQNLEAVRELARTLTARFGLDGHPACRGDILRLASNGVIIQHSEKGIDITCAETINLCAKNIHLHAEEILNLQSEGVVRMAANASSVSVNPNGVALRSLKVVDAVTPYDSAVYIDALSGVTVSGNKVRLNSLFSTKMSDGFGASVITAGAVTQLSGALIDAATVTKDALTKAFSEADETSGLNTVTKVLESWKGGTTPDGAPRSIADHGITVGSTIASPNDNTLPPGGNYRTAAAGVIAGMENATGIVGFANHALDAAGSAEKESFLARRLADAPGTPSITVRELLRATAFADQLNPHIEAIKVIGENLQAEHSASVSLFGHLLTINTKFINDLSAEKFSDAADGAGKI